MCIISHLEIGNEVAHIYPFSLRDTGANGSYHPFWGMLRSFWSAEKIEQWEASISGEGGTEKCDNLVTLCPTLHKLWGMALFGLEPVYLSEDRRILEVRFFWMRRFTHPTAIDLAFRVQNFHKREASVFDSQTGQMVTSGTIIRFTTDDPHSKPLPNWDILSLQWLMQRLAAMSGAAEVGEDDHFTDDEETHIYSISPAEESASGTAKSRYFILAPWVLQFCSFFFF